MIIFHLTIGFQCAKRSAGYFGGFAVRRETLMKSTGVRTQRRFVDTLLKAIVLCLLVCPCALRAQMNSGTIAGFVSDPSGATIPDAAIVATDVATHTATRAVTLQDGNYLLNYLVPGTYEVQISKSGFITSVETGV